MDGTNDLHVEEHAGTAGAEFFVETTYDLTGFDHPALGPYSERQQAIRALEEISVTLSGASS